MADAREVSSGWRFNPPANSWYGGFYERLVAVVKAPLRKVLGRALVSRNELATLLAEVQFIVNERPLTHVGGLDDLLPLNPNMMTGLRVERDGNGEEMADDNLVMNKRIKYFGQLRRNVEVRWRQEYLLSLKSFHESRSHSLCVGDVVLVVDDQRKRSMWKSGVIVDLFPGRDGHSSALKIKVGNRKFLRPVQRLVPLEVSSI